MVDEFSRSRGSRPPSAIGVIPGADHSISKIALILNSRQSKQPLGSDRWVENTSAAVAYAIGRNYTLVTSFGISTYELVTYLGAALNARMIVLVPSAGTIDSHTIPFLISQFNLNTSKVSFHPVGADRPIPKGWWIGRDRVAVDLSDLILPVSVNPSGNLAKMVRECRKGDAVLDETFAVGYGKPERRLYHPVDPSRLIVAKDQPWPYVTHWTRSFDGPWPGENLFEYYRSVAGSGSDYSHSALNSLRNILRRSEIIGTSLHIKDGYRVVSFTDHHPADAMKLMRWRARFVRWSFEPYGIAIGREYAESIGIRPVLYGTSDLYKELPQQDKPYFQNAGEKRGDWKPEHERRYHGNLRLKDIPSTEMKVIVRRRLEVGEVQKLTSSEVIALTDEGQV